MSKEEYLQLRNTRNTAEIMYEFYKEGFDAEKHKPFLVKEEFFVGMSQWEAGGFGQIFVPSVLSYFDSKFGIIKMSNKDGQIMKFL